MSVKTETTSKTYSLITLKGNFSKAHLHNLTIMSFPGINYVIQNTVIKDNWTT